MHRFHRRRTLLAAAIGLVLLAIVGVPRLLRRAPGPLLEQLYGVQPLADLLRRGDAARGNRRASDPAAPALLGVAGEDRAAGADELEYALASLAKTRSAPAAVARAAGGVLCGAPLPELAAGDSPPPLLRARPILGLGAQAAAVEAASAANLAALPPELRRALDALAAAVIRAAEGADTAARTVAAGRSRESVRELLLAAARREPASPVVSGADALACARAFDRRGALALAVGVAECLEAVRPELERAAHDPVVARLPALPAGDGVPNGLLFASASPAGLILIGGAGSTVLPLSGVALAIDLSGDDRWHGAAELGTASAAEPLIPAVRVLVDVAGSDRYAGSGASIGAAVLGISLAWDFAGDDHYVAEEVEFGASVLGVGLLLDDAGRDHYECGACGLGFAWGGLAALGDGGGDDRYVCERSGIAAATAGGAAVVLDRAGFDLYFATGTPGTAGLDPGGPALGCLGAAWSEGSAMPGGAAILLDVAGDDVYRAHSLALGVAAGAALGCFVDVAGDDLYSAGDRALGAAERGGFALFRDLDGDDDYLSRARSQGFGGAALGVFVDDGGSDSTAALIESRGVGADGGHGIYAKRD